MEESSPTPSPAYESLRVILFALEYVLGGIIAALMVPATFMFIFSYISGEFPSGEPVTPISVGATLFIIVMMWSYSAVSLALARSLQKRHRFVRCRILSIVFLLYCGFGTILGIMNLFYLTGSGVRSTFDLA